MSTCSQQGQQFLLTFRLQLEVILEPDWSMARPLTHLGTRYLILRTPAGNLEHQPLIFNFLFSNFRFGCYGYLQQKCISLSSVHTPQEVVYYLWYLLSQQLMHLVGGSPGSASMTCGYSLRLRATQVGGGGRQDKLQGANIMWQSRVEIEGYSVAYFDRIAVF